MAIRQQPTIWLFLAVLVSTLATSSHALVNYEAGQLELNGVLLLQDAQDSKAYYYLPTAPRSESVV